MDNISDRNPSLDEMEERGWAWIQRSTTTGEHGAPYTDDEYAAEAVERLHGDSTSPEMMGQQQELLIVSWE